MVLLIIGVLSSIAIPRFANSIARHRLNATARRVIADLALARQHAISTSAAQEVAFVVAQDRYTLVGMQHLDDPAKVYGVSLSDEPYGAQIATASFGGDASVIFDMYGDADSGGSVTIQVGRYRHLIPIDAANGRTPQVKQLIAFEVP